MYIISIQLYYLKLPIINFKLPNARHVESLISGGARKDQEYFF